MKTTLLQSLHTKALCCIEMMGKCKRAEMLGQSRLYKFLHAEWDDPIRLMNNQIDLLNNVERHKRIYNRIESAYKNILQKINNNQL